jgi:hypothetical protein
MTKVLVMTEEDAYLLREMLYDGPCSTGWCIRGVDEDMI